MNPTASANEAAPGSPDAERPRVPGRPRRPRVRSVCIRGARPPSRANFARVVLAAASGLHAAPAFAWARSADMPPPPAVSWTWQYEGSLVAMALLGAFMAWNIVAIAVTHRRFTNGRPPPTRRAALHGVCHEASPGETGTLNPAF